MKLFLIRAVADTQRCAPYGTKQGDVMFASAKLQAIICTSRIQRAEQFYGGVLGLALQARSQGALVYDVGGTSARVSPVPSTRPSEHTVLGFAVPDIASAIAVLRERGV